MGETLDERDQGVEAAAAVSLGEGWGGGGVSVAVGASDGGGGASVALGVSDGGRVSLGGGGALGLGVKVVEGVGEGVFS